MGDIAAAICTAIILHLELNWLLALALPAVCNIAWGFLCLTLAPEPAEMGLYVSEEDRREQQHRSTKRVPTGKIIIDDAEEKTTITFMDAVRIPNVAAYATAFGFFKLINYVLFFWLPFFLNRCVLKLHSPPNALNP